jgi:hypothetical protein
LLPVLLCGSIGAALLMVGHVVGHCAGVYTGADIADRLLIQCGEMWRSGWEDHARHWC